jgi:sugar O-acyltransferase (sialic acid O-acetyltransferase NeuD family)
MKNDYFIVGSGGFAKEVYFLASQTLDESHVFKGFIDFAPKSDVIIARGRSLPVLDENYFIENIPAGAGMSLYMGIGNPALISTLAKRFEKYVFPNLIHKNFIGDLESIRFGKGNIITAGCVFTVDIIVGSFNIFNLNTTVGHDAVIGDCNVFNPACNVSGGVHIGSQNLFGTNATILQYLQTGDGNIIGASALLSKYAESNGMYVGVPAKRIKEL